MGDFTMNSLRSKKISDQLFRRRWLVIPIIGLMVIFIESLEHYLVRDTLLSLHYFIEVLVYGIAIPIIGVLIIGWIDRVGKARDHLEQPIQERTVALERAIQTEALLKEQYQFMTTVFESLPHPFYVIDAADYTIKMANSASYVGVLHENTSCYNLIHGRSAPCDDIDYLCPLQEIRANRQAVVTEHIHYDGEGVEQVYEVHAHPIFNDQGDVSQIIEYTLDITERKGIEDALRESEVRWRSLAENSPDNIVTLDMDLNIQFVNNASPGLTAEELIGTPIYTLVGEGRQAEIKGILENVIETRQPTRYETEYDIPDGSTITYESSVVPRILADEVTGLTLVARDITEHIRIEEALRERTHTLGERIKELNCLYTISAMVEVPGITLPKILQGTVEIIPPSWQYPEITGARLILGDEEYHTGNYTEFCAWKQTADIKVRNHPVGLVEVGYLEARPASDEGPFLKEERNLIDAIARRLGRITERIQAEDALQKAHDHLELRIQERTVALERANQALQSEVAERRRAYEAEQYTRQIAETLRAASQALTHTISMDTVLATLLDYLGRLVPYDRATVLLLEDESRLSLRAARGYEPWTEPDQLLGVSIIAEEVPQVHEVITRQQSLLIPDTHEHPGWKVIPGQEHVANWLGVPLAADEKVIGLCGMDKTGPGFFTQEHLELAEALVDQASVAIQNAWLSEQVRAGRERLQSLSLRLVEVKESERRDIARDLHDTLAQNISFLRLKLDQVSVQNPLLGIKELHDELESMRVVADEAYEQMRGTLEELHPDSQVRLEQALRSQVGVISARTGFAVQWHVTGTPRALRPHTNRQILYICREVLNNIEKHAHAMQVKIDLLWGEADLSVTIVDDGNGYNTNTSMNKQNLGMTIMAERAQDIKGQLMIDSEPGQGSTVSLQVPYSTKP